MATTYPPGLTIHETTVPVYSPWIQSLLQEITRALQSLLDLRVTHCIDLTHLPLTPNDRQVLQQILGEGEVRVDIGVLGKTAILETAVSGVWWVRHYEPGGGLVSELLEMALVPEIVETQLMDVQESLTKLHSGVCS
ncbi:MAG: hydrogenase expression/formation protein [Gammaproteobacteria bacterium]|nr:hydrogenase expression/formation protein [Gammaproteobacteria bacterium]MDH5800684.1 hydrogenase expression/formation protein [Gammaproteobacteria bacterium]